MNKKSDLDAYGHNMEPAFLRSLYQDETRVPDYLLANYREIGLSDQEFVALLRVMACQQKFQSAVPRDRLLARWRGDAAELSAALAALQRQGVLQAQEDNTYSLAGLYEKLLELWVFQHSVPLVPEPSAETQTVSLPEPELTEVIKTAYQLFEGEFARPLSPLEMEKLNAWLIADRWDFAMLKEAMRRAVLHNALNLAYIDKILLRWKREGIATIEQLQVKEGPLDKTRREGKTSGSKTGRSKNKVVEPSFVGEADYSKYF